MLSSKSSSSSRSPDQLSARCTLRAATVWSKSVCCGIVRLGPDGKIQTTLSDRPLGVWQLAHEPQPLFDMRPTSGAVVPGAASNSPIEVCGGGGI